jgi:hypothetical protein
MFRRHVLPFQANKPGAIVKSAGNDNGPLCKHVHLQSRTVFGRSDVFPASIALWRP